jgi:hypothetical protein
MAGAMSGLDRVRQVEISKMDWGSLEREKVWESMVARGRPPMPGGKMVMVRGDGVEAVMMMLPRGSEEGDCAGRPESWLRVERAESTAAVAAGHM